MNKFAKFLLLTAFLFPLILSAAETDPYYGSAISSTVSIDESGNELKWEEGNHDFFVMFKSLLKSTTNQASGSNPEPEACMSEMDLADFSSTGKGYFELKSGMIPEDAEIEKAYLIWVAAQEPSDIASGVTPDNSVTLTFKHSNSALDTTATITGTRNGILGTGDVPGQQDFAFEGISWYYTQTEKIGYFTYRKDITDFFTTIHQKGRDAELANDGFAVMGKYAVSDLLCSEHEYYKPSSGSSIMVNGWAIFFVYKTSAENFKPKKIYVYNGLMLYQYQEDTINVSGFEFPKDPTVRLTFMASEGDPNLASATYVPDGSWTAKAAPPEGLYFKGDETLAWKRIYNECNPAKNTDSNGTAFEYVEVYNSISSMYYWDSDTPTCIGGDPTNVNQNEIEYGMDVDTFVFTQNDYPGHLNVGTDNVSLKVSVNGDLIFSNFLVVSLDTKPVAFDIPGEQEKAICTCSSSPAQACTDRPLYFTIKVQNWGDDIAKEVKVRDVLKESYKYVPGTTEVTYRFKKGTTEEKTQSWTKLEDSAGSAFPLAAADGYQIPEDMMPCDETTKDTCDTVYIRFKVTLPDGLSSWGKGEVLENQATITDKNGTYKTNSDVVLKVRMDTLCPTIAECAEPSKASCGEDLGNGEAPECTKDEDCADGQKCSDEGTCYTETTEGLTTNAMVTVSVGENSPKNGSNGIIYVPSTSTDVVIGQMKLRAIDVAHQSTDYKFNLNSAFITFDFKGVDASFLSNLKLFHDVNGNGIKDSMDTELSSKASINGTKVEFTVLKQFQANKDIYFIITSDITGTALDATNYVQAYIDVAGSIQVSDAGSASSVLDGTVRFGKYSTDPSGDIFIFTKGVNDPAIPAVAPEDNVFSVMQIRANAKNRSNTITSITFESEENDGFALLGDGINSISIYKDANGNGAIDSGDLLVAMESSFDDSYSHTMNVNISVAQDTDTFLLVKAELSMPEGTSALLRIPLGGLTLATSQTIVKLPLESKTFSISNGSSEEEDTGCSCSTINVEEKNTAIYLLVFAGLLAAMIMLRKVVSKI